MTISFSVMFDVRNPKRRGSIQEVESSNKRPRLPLYDSIDETPTWDRPAKFQFRGPIPAPPNPSSLTFTDRQSAFPSYYNTGVPRSQEDVYSNPPNNSGLPVAWEVPQQPGPSGIARAYDYISPFVSGLANYYRGNKEWLVPAAGLASAAYLAYRGRKQIKKKVVMPIRRRYRKLLGRRGRGVLKGRGAYRFKAGGSVRPRIMKLRGRGGFFGDLWNGIKKYTPRGSLGALGGGIGTLVGGPGGAAIGSVLGGGLSKVLGFGAYRVNKNSLMTNAQVPAMHSTTTGIRVVHKEYLADIQSSTAFTMQQVYNINPGLPASFPWLSQIAQQFEEYVPNGIIYYFRSTAGDALASADNALGAVIMAADYNVINANFVNKIEMENTMWSTSGKPSCDNMLPIECSKRENPLNTFFVRTGAAPALTDLRMYDLANAQIATQGSQGAYDVGELWVSYDFTFRKPIIQPSTSGGLSTEIPFYHAYSSSSVSTSAYFGTSTTIRYNTFSTAPVIGTTTITFPVGLTGTFWLGLDWVGTGAGVSGVSVTPSGGAHALNIGLSNTSSVDNGATDYAPGTLAGSSPTATALVQNYYFYILDPTTAGVLTLSTGTLPTSPSVDVKIAMLDPRLTATS